MALLSRDGEPFRVPTTAREVYDVVGAGDTVTAYLAAMLGAGATPREAAVVANFAAGVEVGKLGAQTVYAGGGARGVRRGHAARARRGERARAARPAMAGGAAAA